MTTKQTATKKSQRTVEERLDDLEKGMEGLLSTVLTLTSSHAENSSILIREVGLLKEQVAAMRNDR